MKKSLDVFDEKETKIIDDIVDLVFDYRKIHRDDVLKFLNCLHNMSERFVETLDLGEEEFANAHASKEST